MIAMSERLRIADDPWKYVSDARTWLRTTGRFVDVAVIWSRATMVVGKKWTHKQILRLIPFSLEEIRQEARVLAHISATEEYIGGPRRGSVSDE